ncbi:MAG: amidohydrolase [Actinomycetota bacterium]|nr:amidohydrolase [Actinomycetota bacterium]
MTDVDLLLSNADHLLVCDPDGGVMSGASVAVADGRIVDVGPSDDVARRVQARETLDARGHILMPGLVNLHTHLPMTLLRGIAEDVDLQGFLSLVWAEEARVMGPDGTADGARLGALEALLGGTTTALDMYFHPEAAHRAAVEVGLRHVIGPVFFSFPGPDNLAWAERMALLASWPETLADIGGPYVPRALMPHAPVTVGSAYLRELAEAAASGGYLIHTHASENTEENDQTEAAEGRRPVAVLEDSGVLALRPVLAHGVRITDDERRLLAARGASIAHCPTSNLKLASGAADLVAMRAEGIEVGLGTDGCASSNDLDMFAVMRQASNLARLVHHDPAAVSSRDIVLCATVGGARALRMEDRIGTVAAGQEADLVLVDTAVPHLTPVRDPYAAIVYSAGRSDVRHVLVAGEVVVRDREPTRVRTHDVIASAKARLR